MTPKDDFTSTTWPGSRSATPRDNVLSTPHATVANITASKPKSWVSPASPCSNTSATPPARRNIMAATTRLSMVSPYKRHARTAVKSASSVNMSEALEPLVRCKPHASATGPNTAPKPAIATILGKSERRRLASLSGEWHIRSATSAAPAYSNAAVVKAPRPWPKN